MILLGAHLHRAQIESVPSVVAIDLDLVWLSAIELGHGRSSSDPAILEQALAAREQLLEAGTFIAIRWGSIVDSADTARERLSDRRASWKEILERRQGLIEMTFKTGSRGRPVRPDYREASSGAQYLRELSEMRKNVEIDEGLLDEAVRSFEPHTVELRRRRREDGGAEIALLVTPENIRSVADAAEKLGKSRPGAAFLLSGPWPLEVFAE